MPEVHDHLDPVAGGVEHLGETVEGGAGAVELAAAVVRQDHRVAARVGRARGVVGVDHALEAELAVPGLDHLGEVVPVHRRVEHLGEVAADRGGRAAHVDMGVELGQGELLVGDVVDPPGGFQHELGRSRRA